MKEVLPVSAWNGTQHSNKYWHLSTWWLKLDQRQREVIMQGQCYRSFNMFLSGMCHSDTGHKQFERKCLVREFKKR